jgi:anti-sigma factor ChrR (cupin superfamily)
MTTPGKPLDDAARDRAAEFALGAIDAASARAFAADAAADPALAREAAEVRRALDLIAAATAAATPSPAVRARLLRRIAATPPSGATPPAQPWKSWGLTSLVGGTAYMPGAEGAFQPTAYPGVEVKPLFADRAASRATMLVRMAPGSAYPAHRHGGFEECFVLEGSLRIGDELLMTKGDYQAAREGSDHPVQRTDEGCLLLISSSLDDELMA